MSKLEALIALTMLLALGLIAGGVYQLVGMGYAMLAAGGILFALCLVAARGVSK